MSYPTLQADLQKGLEANSIREEEQFQDNVQNISSHTEVTSTPTSSSSLLEKDDQMVERIVNNEFISSTSPINQFTEDLNEDVNGGGEEEVGRVDEEHEEHEEHENLEELLNGMFGLCGG